MLEKIHVYNEIKIIKLLRMYYAISYHYIICGDKDYRSK